jgi:hypothetical protein
MEPRNTSRHSLVRSCLPTRTGTFAGMRNRHGPRGTTKVGRHDQTYRTRLFWAMHTVASAATPARPCRVEMLQPNFDWRRIWSNLHAACIPDTVRSVWYMAIHDILSTRERLHSIALDDTAHCTHCWQIDTLSHRLMHCGAGKEM